LTETAGSTRLEAQLMVQNTGDEAWFFDNHDFQIFVSANRTADDSPPRQTSKLSGGHQSNRAGLNLRKSEAVTSLSGAPGRVFLEPGRWALLQVNSGELLEKEVQWIKSHPGEPRCTISDANDNPAGDIGYLSPPPVNGSTNPSR